MRRSPNHRHAFTLLESLLAIMLLGLVCGGLVAWLRAEAIAIADRDALDRDGLVARWCLVLRDDLFSASAVTFDEGSGRTSILSMRTSHALPAEPPGWSEVTWRSAGSGSGLLRDRAGSIRNVPLTGARLELDVRAVAGKNGDTTEVRALWLTIDDLGRFFIATLPVDPER